MRNIMYLLTLQIGDTVEIVYNGDILESYPAQ